MLYCAVRVAHILNSIRKKTRYFIESEPADICNCSNNGRMLLVISVLQTLMAVR